MDIENKKTAALRAKGGDYISRVHEKQHPRFGLSTELF